MPALKRVKWEIFAQEVSNGSKHVDAYIKAGYEKKFAGQNADKLLKNTKIAERIKELQNEIAERYLLSKEEMLIELGRIVRDMTGSNRDIIAAIHQASKMQGFESEIIVNIDKGVEELSDKELSDIIKRSSKGTSDKKESKE